MITYHPMSDLAVPDLTVLAGRHLGLLLSVVWKHLPPDGKRLHFLRQSADTHTAHAKARWLPKGIWVQKTISLLVATRTQHHLVLITGVGDFRLQPPQKRRLSWLLTGTTHAHLHINPAEASPEQITGLPAGMVSPFLPPREHGNWPIEALFVLPTPPEAHRHHVAVSLALSSSLLVPVESLPAQLAAYGGRCFPRVPVLTLPSSTDWENATGGGPHAPRVEVLA